MRIRQPAAKVGYVLVVAIGITLTSFPLAAIRFELGFAWATAFLVAAVIVAARAFRGATEPDGPRPWWKVTSTRGSGVLLSALFFAQGAVAASGAFTSPSPPLALLGGLVALTLAGFSLNSAIRTQPSRAPR